ncbi:MAG TPA: hypothetical protein VNV66_06190 [Pilimelia sp.]|nr:hypothetical protein [Pilimelia sp.]
MSGDGNDALDGARWEDRVKTFSRARALVRDVRFPNQVRFLIGQFNMSRGTGFGQQLGTGTAGGLDIADGWSMRAVDPGLPWHFTDLDVLNAPADFVKVYRETNGSYNAHTADCPDIENNNGAPRGAFTGIWVTARDVAGPAPLYRVARVWRGGNPLTINSRSAVPSAYDPYNEIWEARDFSTLGNDETHVWTQLSPGTPTTPREEWPASAGLTPPPKGRRVYLYCPKSNPATVWGGITILSQWSAGAQGRDLGLMTIQASNGWHVEESVRAIGGGIIAFNVLGNCTDGRFEARLDVMSPYYPVVELAARGTADSFTAIEVSPRWDMRVVGKPYYEFDPKHTTGRSDALRIAGNANVRGLLVRGRTTDGAPCYVRDPGHGAVVRAIPSAGKVLEELVIERDFSVYMGGMQYQRAFGITGDRNSVKNCTIGGRVYGQSAPTQIDGDVRIIGLEIHHGHQLIPAAPDGVSGYPSRFNDQTRVWNNLSTNGKNRDAAGLVVTMSGAIEVRDCVFNSVHGPGVIVQHSGAVPVGSCIVANCTFVNSAVPDSEQTAVLIDTRNDASPAIRLVDNLAVGYRSDGGAQWTSNGNTRTPIALEDLKTATPGPKIAENTGWQRGDFTTCIG